MLRSQIYIQLTARGVCSIVPPMRVSRSQPGWELRGSVVTDRGDGTKYLYLDLRTIFKYLNLTF